MLKPMLMALVGEKFSEWPPEEKTLFGQVAIRDYLVVRHGVNSIVARRRMQD